MPIAASRRALHLIISPGLSGNWLISIVYNVVRFQAQCSLWQELSKLTHLQLPWLIVGDFNSIISNDEYKRGLFSYYSCKARCFLIFNEDNNLLDLYYIGSKYTWCNNQSGMVRRWARLDRCLVNLAWSSKFSSYTLKHLSRLFLIMPLFSLLSVYTLIVIVVFFGLITFGFIILIVTVL